MARCRPLLNLVAIALERVRAQEAATRAEVARQSEEFKSTLLDAIAHEFKTPLTSIKSGIRHRSSPMARLCPRRCGKLMAIIDEETDRLSLLVTEAARMAGDRSGQCPAGEAAGAGASAAGPRSGVLRAADWRAGAWQCG